MGTPLLNREKLFVTSLVTLATVWFLLAGVYNALAVIFAVLLLCVAITRLVRQRFRVSLRVLLLGCTAIGVSLGWWIGEARTQRAAVSNVRRAGGYVLYDYVAEAGAWAKRKNGALFPTWLRDMLGDDMVAQAEFVDVGRSNLENDDLPRLLTELKYLKELRLSGSQVSGEGLQHLQHSTGIERVWITKDQASEQGFRHLAELPTLDWLTLHGPSVTDDVLSNLRPLPQLRFLSLYQTSVTDDGVKRLERDIASWSRPGFLILKN